MSEKKICARVASRSALLPGRLARPGWGRSGVGGGEIALRWEDPPVSGAGGKALAHHPKVFDVAPKALDDFPKPFACVPKASDVVPKASDVDPKASDVDPKALENDPKALDVIPKASDCLGKAGEGDANAQTTSPESVATRAAAALWPPQGRCLLPRTIDRDIQTIVWVFQ